MTAEPQALFHSSVETKSLFGKKGRCLCVHSCTSLEGQAEPLHPWHQGAGVNKPEASPEPPTTSVAPQQGYKPKKGKMANPYQDQKPTTQPRNSKVKAREKFPTHQHSPDNLSPALSLTSTCKGHTFKVIPWLPMPQGAWQMQGCQEAPSPPSSFSSSAEAQQH